MELKKQTTFEEQLELLKYKGIMIEHPEGCIEFLKRVNYYRFSAYYLQFRDPKTQKLLSPAKFEQLQKIYEFDQELRGLIFSAIENIEVYLRTQIAYYHVHKYGSEGYRELQHYNNGHNHADFLQRLSGCVNENKKTLIVQHHLDKYGGHFPFWAMIEFFSMGMLSHFYRDLATQDRKKIAKILYGTNYKNLESWTRCLTDLRNRCAHYSRLYYWAFPAIPRFSEKETHTATRKLFSQIYMLKLMYPDHSEWNERFLKPLARLMRRYKPYISRDHMDFPYHWKSMLKR